MSKKNLEEEVFEKFFVTNTKTYGIGVYAKKDIKKGEEIWVLTGQRIGEIDCDAMIARGELNNDDPLQISHDEYYILDDISHAFNHSCDPNSALRGESTLFAIRDIKKGEEIVYDYSTTVDPKNFTFTTMSNCLCGSQNCRKSLGNVLSIPKHVLDIYIKEGAIQDYILNELKNNK